MAIRAAKQATKTIPIVLVAVGDPVREGLVASLARPGGNITGLTSISEELSGKRLELVTETFPKSRRVAVLWNSSNSSNALEFKEMESAARALGLKLQSLKVQHPEEFQRALTSAARDRPSALIVVRDPLIDSHLNNPAGIQKLRLIKAVLYIATPAQGADLADLGVWLSLNPQFSDMRSANSNSYLQTLRINGRI